MFLRMQWPGHMYIKYADIAMVFTYIAQQYDKYVEIVIEHDPNLFLLIIELFTE